MASKKAIKDAGDSFWGNLHQDLDNSRVLGAFNIRDEE